MDSNENKWDIQLVELVVIKKIHVLKTNEQKKMHGKPLQSRWEVTV